MKKIIEKSTMRGEKLKPGPVLLYCQYCGKPATSKVIASNKRRPDYLTTYVCDEHLK
jgi:hypothetical protein